MSRRFQKEVGFTLIEMLIVIIILGILAAIIIPQLTVSTEDAKVSTLKTNVGGLRSAIVMYHAQHNEVYPGYYKIDGTEAVVNNAGEAATAFVDQLTRYTEKTGKTSNTKTADAKYGPYLKGGKLPANPFNESSAVVCDIATADITTRDWDGTGTAGWHFYILTGVFVANDSADHDDY